MHQKLLNTCVGIFMIAGLVALILLALNVSGLTHLTNKNSYTLHAEFDNIGNLKPRATISIGGVKIGYVKSITLDPNTFRARVNMDIDKSQKNLPDDTSASIYTQGLLGANYINLTPGFDNKTLTNNSEIQTTHSALILENLIGQLLFNFSNSKKTTSQNNQTTTKPITTNSTSAME